jgi:uncharacterized protein YceK
MKHLSVLLLLTILLAGCASTRPPTRIAYGQRQAQRLAAAAQLLARDETRGATNLLTSICMEPAVPGVTDEALFRLSLVQMGSATEVEGLRSARQTMERLRREYPTSSWSKQAAPLLALMTTQSEQQRTSRELLRAKVEVETLNLSLGAENKRLTLERDELREKLDRLKGLDLELEDKSR